MEQVEKQPDNNTKQLGGATGKGFMPGVSGNPLGRPKLTSEQKLMKKSVRDIIKEYEESLAESLPKLSPVLKNKALEGDMQAIKELHEVVGAKAGKGSQNVAPVIDIKVQALIAKVNNILLDD